MSFFSFASVDNYKQMLRKLSWYTGIVTLFCIIILRTYVPPIAQMSDWINSIFPDEAATLLRISVSFAGVAVPAVLISLFAHSIKLHDRLSDLLRIRHEFDVHYVLYPLAIASGACLSIAQFSKVRQMRKSLMGSTFYAYVSSTNPVIDSHTITQALTNWSWFWASLEAIVILSLTAIILALYGAYFPSTCILIVCTFLLLIMRFFRLQSAIYAESQVVQILRDETRRSLVAAEFNAL